MKHFWTMYGVAMNVNLNDDGTFTINDGSTYPTTETLNCSTYATVPAVAEAGTWIGTPGFDHPDDANAHSMGWGISLYPVFLHNLALQTSLVEHTALIMVLVQIWKTGEWLQLITQMQLMQHLPVLKCSGKHTMALPVDLASMMLVNSME